MISLMLVYFMVQKGVVLATLLDGDWTKQTACEHAKAEKQELWMLGVGFASKDDDVGAMIKKRVDCSAYAQAAPEKP